jgi:hypothetical protein
LCAVLATGCVGVEFGVGVETGQIEGPTSFTPSGTVAPAIPLDTTVPDEAGGLVRNRTTESSIPDLLVQVRDQLPVSAVMLASISYAVYHQPDVDAPNGDIFLLRGEVTDPDTMLAAARARPNQRGAPTTLDLGASAEGGCTQSPNSGGFLIPVCVWVSGDAFAHITPLTPVDAPLPPPTTAELADIAKAMLPDLV